MSEHLFVEDNGKKQVIIKWVKVIYKILEESLFTKISNFDTNYIVIFLVAFSQGIAGLSDLALTYMYMVSVLDKKFMKRKI